MTHSVVYSAPEHHLEPGTLKEGISSVDVPGFYPGLLICNCNFHYFDILFNSTAPDLDKATQSSPQVSVSGRSCRSTGQYQNHMHLTHNQSL